MKGNTERQVRDELIGTHGAPGARPSVSSALCKKRDAIANRDDVGAQGIGRWVSAIAEGETSGADNLINDRRRGPRVRRPVKAKPKCPDRNARKHT